MPGRSQKRNLLSQTNKKGLHPGRNVPGTKANLPRYHPCYSQTAVAHREPISSGPVTGASVHAYGLLPSTHRLGSVFLRKVTGFACTNRKISAPQAIGPWLRHPLCLSLRHCLLNCHYYIMGASSCQQPKGNKND